MLHIPGLYIANNEKGRGIFSAEDISPGDLIEICPLLKIPSGQLDNLNPTVIFEYYFIWEEEGYEACLALGYGSLYNHSNEPNAKVILDYTDESIKIEAIEKIKSGDEILIDYTGGTKGQVELWF